MEFSIGAQAFRVKLDKNSEGITAKGFQPFLNPFLSPVI